MINMCSYLLTKRFRSLKTKHKHDAFFHYPTTFHFFPPPPPVYSPKNTFSVCSLYPRTVYPYYMITSREGRA